MTDRADIAISPAGRRGRPPKTSRDDVVDAALRIADSEGLAALSMRRLADELGLAVTTLYNHVTSKDDLVELLRERTLGALELDPHSNAPWRVQLLDALVGVYDAFREHPSGIDVLYSQPAIFEPGLRAILDSLTATLQSAGFTRDRAIDTLQTLQIYVAAMAGHERVQTRRHHELDTAPRDEHPEAVEHARAWIRPAPRDTFRTGLIGLIDALTSEYARAPKQDNHPSE